MRDRRFHIFNNPVDVEDANDYYEIIARPICMSDMMGKIDRREYRTPEQFVADINLIMANALEYNPPDTEGRVIRHNAVALRDMCDALLDMELDEKFVEKMQESKRLLKEAGVKLKKEVLPFEKTAPPQKFTRSAAAAGFVNDLDETGEEMKKEEGEGGEMEEQEDSGEEEEMDHDGPSTSATTPKTPASSRKKRRRFGTYSEKKKKSSGKKERARSHSKTPEDVDSKAAAAVAAAIDDQAAESMDSIDGSSKERASDESASGEERKSSREEKRSSQVAVAAAAAAAAPLVPSPPRAESEGNSSAQSSGTPEKSGGEEGGVKKSTEGGEGVVEEKMEEEEEKEVLRIDEAKMREVVEKCTSLTREWPAPELERLAAALIHEIDLRRECWDRRSLPAALLQIVETWHYE